MSSGLMSPSRLKFVAAVAEGRRAVVAAHPDAVDDEDRLVRQAHAADAAHANALAGAGLRALLHENAGHARVRARPQIVRTGAVSVSFETEMLSTALPTSDAALFAGRRRHDFLRAARRWCPSRNRASPSVRRECERTSSVPDSQRESRGFRPCPRERAAIVYFPSGPVLANRLVPTTITRDSWRGIPDPAAVTVPLRLPCAPATAAVAESKRGTTVVHATRRDFINLIGRASLNGAQRWELRHARRSRGVAQDASGDADAAPRKTRVSSGDWRARCRRASTRPRVGPQRAIRRWQGVACAASRLPVVAGCGRLLHQLANAALHDRAQVRSRRDA